MEERSGAEAIMHSLLYVDDAYAYREVSDSHGSYASRPSRTLRIRWDGKDTHGELDQQYARQFG